MIEHFKKIKVETTADKIIKQIRGLISSGQLNPGDKLPSERELAERFAVGRSYVRDAIRKLEFYGILRTLPQSGTRVEGLGIAALEGLISDVLAMEESDFYSLVETRVTLEIKAASLAAQNRTPEDIIAITKALDNYENKLHDSKKAIEEDLLFHLKIAEASGNTVLKSLMLIITPDIIKKYAELNICDDPKTFQAIQDHRVILEHIKNQDSDAVEQAMSNHLKGVLDYSKSVKNTIY
jgi:GntR family transcriptional repressor for pyruvate dehydrogenase complex